MWITVAGLTLDLLGVIALGFVLPRHSVNLITEAGPTSRAADNAGRLAERCGWPFVALGFALQLVGQFWR